MNIISNEEVKQEEVVEEKPKFQQINYAEFGKPVAKQEPATKIKMPIDLIKPMTEKKKAWGTKSWWIFKGPILAYLLLTYGYTYLSGMAFSTYLNNNIIIYAALIVHTMILMMFGFLCAATRGGDKK